MRTLTTLQPPTRLVTLTPFHRRQDHKKIADRTADFSLRFLCHADQPSFSFLLLICVVDPPDVIVYPAPASALRPSMKFLQNQKLPPPYQLAVDVGCGSGQSSGILAPHFSRILGLDTSEAQIKEAIKRETNKNVEYRVGTCNSLPVDDSSVELITVSQAAHWFDLTTFYKEVDRVLVPGGILAMYCYLFPEPVKSPVASELKQHINRIYREDTAPYWNKRRKIVDDKYKDIILPYTETVRDESCFQDMEWTVADMVGYIESWSGYQGLQEANPQKANEAVVKFTNSMMATLKGTGRPEETKCTLRWNYFVLMSRKPL